MSFVGKKFKNAYGSFLNTNADNNGISISEKAIKDGLGTSSSCTIGKDTLKVRPSADSTEVFSVKDKDGNNLFKVDSSNNKVLTGVSQVYSNTMYKEFGVYDLDPTLNVYYPLPCNTTWENNDAFEADDDIMGTGPATSLDISSVGGFGAEVLIASIWYLPDNITIDSAKAFGTASGHDLGCKIFSYDIVSSSGATGGDLSNGTELCTGNIPTTNNALNIATLTVSSANVTAGKVILAMIRNETGTNNFTARIQIKYHIQ